MNPEIDAELAQVRLCVDGPVAFHNMPCAVCHVRKAVYVLNDDIFKPCWKCQETWELRHRPWYSGLFRRQDAAVLAAAKGGA